MKLSMNGLHTLQRLEGFVPAVYLDQAGLPTIGIGHLLTREEMPTWDWARKDKGEARKRRMLAAVPTCRWPKGVTLPEALDLLDVDLDSYEEAVNAKVTVPLTQNQFDALVIFCFNIGVGGFGFSSALRYLNAGEYTKVPPAMALWNKITNPVTKAKEVSPGLVKRRQAEMDLFNR